MKIHETPERLMTEGRLSEIRAYLKAKNCKTSFRTREEARAFVRSLFWTEAFPWNEDQQRVLGNEERRENVVQGVFGSGKTTMMIGLFMRRVLFDHLSPDEVLFCAFNISIRNELRKKTRVIKTRPMVRTFDSLIYQICAAHGMEMDKSDSDFEGRRRFVEKLLATDPDHAGIAGWHKIRLVLVDEVQDLERAAHMFFRVLFPNARFYFFGDVFQCIQKEPRSSLLWHLLRPAEERRIEFMKKTPRVPPNILVSIQDALVHHYPEYTDPIREWYSSNPRSITETRIEWVPIGHYSAIFEETRRFLAEHPPQECMILTFSSAITVRGNMGDLSRFRQFLVRENVPVNRNYKSMDPDRLFLSTVNSSKGLERPYVLIALTFPLELAFANFSNDLVVNLISVGLSRCKVRVRFCVPIYADRFSRVLRLYPDCPAPTEISTLHGGKKQSAVSVVDRPLGSAPEGVAEYLLRSHSVTEILRQGILSHATRSDLRSTARYTPLLFPPGERTRWSMKSEEEASFLGILFEVLITSLWTNRWPFLDVAKMQDTTTNPMYAHCRGGLERHFQKIAGAFRAPYASASSTQRFDSIFQYTEYHILLSQKIRVHITWERQDEMRRVWNFLSRDLQTIRPEAEILPHLKPQVNLSRPFQTGIADLFYENEQEVLLYEIKTCSGSDWTKDAFTQAAIYMAMTRRLHGRIRLLNPFRRELGEYQISLLARKGVILQMNREMLLWNLNCYLAKYESSRSSQPVLEVHDIVCVSGEVFLEWMAPTKTRIGLYSTEKEYERQKKTLVRLDPAEPHLQDLVGLENRETLVNRILQRIRFTPPEDAKFEIDWTDPFSHCVLLACFLRNHYRLI